MPSNQLNISHKIIHTKSLLAIKEQNKKKINSIKKQLILGSIFFTVAIFVLISVTTYNFISISAAFVLFIYILLRFKTFYKLKKINGKIENKIQELSL